MRGMGVGHAIGIQAGLLMSSPVSRGSFLSITERAPSHSRTIPLSLNYPSDSYIEHERPVTYPSTRWPSYLPTRTHPRTHPSTHPLIYTHARNTNLYIRPYLSPTLWRVSKMVSLPKISVMGTPPMH